MLIVTLMVMMIGFTLSLREKHVGSERRIDCKIKNVIDKLDGDDSEWLVEILDTDDSSSSIVRTINENTRFSISHATLSRHRRKECPCYRGDKK